MDQPPAIPEALPDAAPGADLARKPPHIDVDAPQGTATQLANLVEGDAEGPSLPDISQAADASDGDLEPPRCLGTQSGRAGVLAGKAT